MEREGCNEKEGVEVEIPRWVFLCISASASETETATDAAERSVGQ